MRVGAVWTLENACSRFVRTVRDETTWSIDRARCQILLVENNVYVRASHGQIRNIRLTWKVIEHLHRPYGREQWYYYRDSICFDGSIFFGDIELDVRWSQKWVSTYYGFWCGFVNVPMTRWKHTNIIGFKNRLKKHIRRSSTTSTSKY